MEIVRTTLKDLRLGAAITHANLAVVPLWTATGSDRRYATLDEALHAGTARVTEVSEAGSVPELRFVNEGDRPVLLLDGEELRGAKQNRVLNLTIIAPAGKTIVVPVSCVERGRWDPGAAAVRGADYVLYAALRSEKAASVSASLARDGRARSDQRGVWASIDGKLARLAEPSDTSAMADAFEARRRGLDAFVGALGPLPGQTGALFALNESVRGLELFDQPSVLATMLPKLVRSWALDAIETPSGDLPAPPEEEAQAFLDMVAEAEMRPYPAVGQGTDVRLESARLTGGAIVDAGRVVHLNAFRLAEAGAGPHRRVGGPAGERPRPRESWIDRVSARLKRRKTA